MNKYAVIVAGGSGTRMGTPTPKQFLLLKGRPVLWHTLTIFLQAYDDLEIILVLPEEYLGEGRALADATGEAGRIRITGGGATRFHSVQKGLGMIGESVTGEGGMREGTEQTGSEGRGYPAFEDGHRTRGESVIFIHDGVRCLLTRELVHRCYAGAVAFGSAIPVINTKDSVRLLTATGNEAVERSRIKLVQTPQTFLGSIILPAYSAAVEYHERFTDEATVVEAAGHSLHLVEGELNNIKITTLEDMTIAEGLLERK
ncbi:MAG TPA: 2-C-methyl-D-erythritol 4-phosphate cytidylyltransferase [Puia sp.]|nr:2-C-methyl-D-erythritol 4-phosphate cytidylyltransferase [Puia sp.]